MRDYISKHPAVAAIASVAAIVIALGAAWASLHNSPRYNKNALRQAFYSADDGKTWFAADASNAAPFELDGRTAVRAVVYLTGNGQLFVACLQQYSADAKAQMASDIAAHPEARDYIESRPMDEVKKPGDSTWILVAGPKANPVAAQKVLAPISPDGSTPLTQVFPKDEDNGAVN